jgi:hypothetical protein
METLWDYLTLTKGHAYIVAFVLMVLFIPFFKFLTERES